MSPLSTILIFKLKEKYSKDLLKGNFFMHLMFVFEIQLPNQEKKKKERN